MKNKIFTVTKDDLTKNAIQTAVSIVSVGDDAPVAGGTHTGQSFNSLYILEITKAGAYGVGEVTVTCSSPGSEDEDFSEVVIPVSGVAFDVGTLGVTATMTDGGDGVLTLGDKYSIQCTGTKFVLPISIDYAVLRVDEGDMFPKRIQIKNATGQIVSFNVLSDENEWLEFLEDDSFFDLLPIANNASLSMSDLNPMPTAAKIILESAATPSSNLTIECINYQKRR